MTFYPHVPFCGMDVKRVVAAVLVTLFFASTFVAVASERREIHVVSAVVPLFLVLVVIVASGKRKRTATYGAPSRT